MRVTLQGLPYSKLYLDIWILARWLSNKQRTEYKSWIVYSIAVAIHLVSLSSLRKVRPSELCLSISISIASLSILRKLHLYFLHTGTSDDKAIASIEAFRKSPTEGRRMQSIVTYLTSFCRPFFFFLYCAVPSEMALETGVCCPEPHTNFVAPSFALPVLDSRGVALTLLRSASALQCTSYTLDVTR